MKGDCECGESNELQGSKRTLEEHCYNSDRIAGIGLRVHHEVTLTYGTIGWIGANHGTGWGFICSWCS